MPSPDAPGSPSVDRQTTQRVKDSDAAPKGADAPEDGRHGHPLLLGGVDALGAQEGLSYLSRTV
jgi:hypothetical protein